MLVSLSSYYVPSQIVTGPSSSSDSEAVSSDTPATANSTSAATAGISQAAKTLSTLLNSSASYYSQFMPTRSGFSSLALATAVSDPGAETFSAGKTTAQVASAARQELDTEYQAMQQSGKPFDYNSSEGADWYSLMGKLDRRALSAVSSNQSGQFTKQEQDIASSIMSQQEGLAIGLYNGPTRLSSQFVDRSSSNTADLMAADMKFLDSVSNDEKTTIRWNVSRAGAQLGYELSGGTGSTAPAGGASPLLKLIESAMSTMKESLQRGTTEFPITTADELKQQPWFQGFESQLDGAIAQTKELHGSG